MIAIGDTPQTRTLAGCEAELRGICTTPGAHWALSRSAQPPHRVQHGRSRVGVTLDNHDVDPNVLTRRGRGLRPKCHGARAPYAEIILHPNG